MSEQSEDLKDMMTETLARENRVKLMSLDPEKRQAQIDLMTEDVETASDFEIMSYLSTNSRIASTEVRDKIGFLQEQGNALDPGMDAFSGRPAIISKINDLIKTRDLQREGVATDEPLDRDQSLAMGFGVEPIKALQRSLSEKFKTKVFVTEKDGELFYLNPKTKSLKLANPTGFGLVGSGMVEVGDIIGTIGMAAATSGRSIKAQVGAETGGSFVGTTVTDLTRLMLGRVMGLHDLTGNEMLLRASITGAKAAAWTGGTGGLVASFKWMKNVATDGVFTKQAAIDAGAGSEEAEIMVEEFNRLGDGGKVFKGTTGKMSPDVNIQADEAAVRELKEFKQAFVDRDLANQAAISEKLDIVTKPKEAQEGITQIGKIAKADVAEKTLKAKREVVGIEAELDNALKDLSSTSSKAVGKPTRNIVIDMKKAENKAQISTWEKMKQKNGFNEETQTYGIDIPEGEGALRLRKIYERRAKTAKTVSGKRAASKIFVGKTEEGTDAGFLLLPDGSKVQMKSTPNRKLQDLNDYNDELSKLSKDIRSLESNPSVGEAAIRDLNETKAAMKADRAKSLIDSGNESLLKEINQAELQTAKYYEKYSEGIIGELTKQTDGVFKLKEANFVSRVLNGSPEEAADIIEVISKSPKLLNIWKEGVADVYKKKVFSGKEFNEEAHKRFLQENGEIMAKFIPDIKNIKKSGNLAIALKAQIDKYKSSIAKINKDWSGKLQSMDSREVLDFITTRKGGFTSVNGEVQHQVSKIKAVKKLLVNDYPSAWKEVQQEYSTKFRNSVLDLKNKQVDNVKLNKKLTEEKEEIVEMMGSKYYDNLLKVNNVAEIAAKKLKKEPDSEVSGIVNALLRMSIAPPLSRNGRGLTALTKFTKKSAHKIIADAFLDVKTISKVAKRAEHNRPARIVLEKLFSTGMLDLEEE